MLIKDLKNVKDEEITLQDVQRAEEIIERANKLLGKKTECNHYHYSGWNYVLPTYRPYWYVGSTYQDHTINLCVGSTTSLQSQYDHTSASSQANGLNLNSSISEAAQALKV